MMKTELPSIVTLLLLIVLPPTKSFTGVSTFTASSALQRSIGVGFVKRKRHTFSFQVFQQQQQQEQQDGISSNSTDDFSNTEVSSSVGKTEGEGGLDAPGFVGYLAPYAFAFIASIGVTIAFVKFVLMSY